MSPVLESIGVETRTCLGKDALVLEVSRYLGGLRFVEFPQITFRGAIRGLARDNIYQKRVISPQIPPHNIEM